MFIYFTHTIALTPPTMLGSRQWVSPGPLTSFFSPHKHTSLFSPPGPGGDLQYHVLALPFHLPLPPNLCLLSCLHLLRMVGEWRPRVSSPGGLEFFCSLQEYRGGGGWSHRALVGPLPSMHQVVLLQVGKLGEALLAQGTAGVWKSWPDPAGFLG